MIEEHGLFWWSDETVAEGHYAPPNAVSGLLTISDEGRIDLELHGQLPLQNGRRGFFREEVPPGKTISGLLKKARNYVLIESISRNGGVISSNGISFDAFMGMRCLILDKIPKLDARIKLIRFPLIGYEDWMGTANMWPKIGRKN